MTKELGRRWALQTPGNDECLLAWWETPLRCSVHGHISVVMSLNQGRCVPFDDGWHGRVQRGFEWLVLSAIALKHKVWPQQLTPHQQAMAEQLALASARPEDVAAVKAAIAARHQ